MSDLAPLLVALPIFGSVAALLIGVLRSRTGWPIAVVVSAVQVAAAVALAVQAFDGTVTYVVGGFEAPFGIELVVDGDRKSTRLNSSHIQKSRMPSSA